MPLRFYVEFPEFRNWFRFVSSSFIIIALCAGCKCYFETLRNIKKQREMVLQLKSALSGGKFSKMKNIAVIFPNMTFSKKQKWINTSIFIRFAHF